MRSRKIFALLLALVLCFSLTTTSFAAEKTETTNKVETVETIETVQPRAGGGSAARYVSGYLTFTFPVGGSGMSKIRVETSGTTDSNITLVKVTTAAGKEVSFNLYGNQSISQPVSNLTAGTYTVDVQTGTAASVVAVYVE